MIFDHNSYEYRMMIAGKRGGQNGAYWYSVELVENIIPKIKTSRNWVTLNVRGRCYNHSIVFIHNNDHPEYYKWLRNYSDLILVCGVKTTVTKIQSVCPMHQVIYLPLSIDTKYVKKFRTEKTKKQAFAGRLSKATDQVPASCDMLGNISRDELLQAMAPYEKVYAVGRCALEAKVLGCKVGIYDPRYPKDIWEVLDNSEVVPILQRKLDAIDSHPRPVKSNRTSWTTGDKVMGASWKIMEEQ